MAKWILHLMQSVTLLICLLSCGGEVHFVAQQIEDPPKPPTNVPKVITENFAYQQSSGAVSVVFGFYPLKTMLDVAEGVNTHIPAFLEEFWNQGKLYDDVNLSLFFDSERASSRWFLPKRIGLPKESWPEASRLFFQHEMPWLTSTFDKDGNETKFPMESFTRIAKQLTGLSFSESVPQWTYYVYFRNRDVFPSPSEEEQLGDFEKRFMGALKEPLSPFRYHVIRFSYRNEGPPCSPSPKKIGKNLERILSIYPGQWFELCDFNGSTFRTLAREIHRKNRKIILRRRPKLDTLEFRAKGNLVPREKLIYHESTNEIGVTAPAAQQIAVGDPIEVRYVPTGS